MKNVFNVLILFLLITNCKGKESMMNVDNMTAQQRKSGDVRGIWLIDNIEEVKAMNAFLDVVMPSTAGYCIEVQENMRKGVIHYSVIEKTFNIDIERFGGISFFV